MGHGYSVTCSACGYHRDLLLGQGDDAFYEFYEERCYFCAGCRQLTVVTTPLPYDLLVFMREQGFLQPWSELTAPGDDPDARLQTCEDLIARYLAGSYEELPCAHCGSVELTECEEIPTTCPQCDCPTLEITLEFEWS